MRSFHFLDAVCLFVVTAFILLETDASPKPSTSKTKLKNEPAEQENPGLTVENGWNSNACHPNLSLSEPKQQSDSKRSKSKKQPSDSTPSELKRYLVVKHFDNGSAKCGSVFAVQQIPKTSSGIFYYEVQILEKTSFFSIGLCPAQMPLDNEIGDFKGTYAYQSHGAFRADSEVMLFDSNKKNIPSFRALDTVGCGVDFKNNNALFYTLNGERLGPTGKIVDSAVDLFPCVTLSKSGDEIKTNFGPKFQYRTANGI
ncbi:hypothetical protein GPALN_014355 [Globodera pallida]|uniref:B30.2/SPRY domain-containing protein n=1 Tax=Globodera pallida TaxID=36090 RepID=A0A183C129_GLOPA|nr:hypothetical protein GPALN_014355 [Globodera pallida]